MLAPMTAATSAHTGSSLVSLLASRASAKEIAGFLDGLAPSARLEQVLAVKGRDVGRLYHAVADAPPVTLEEIVPQGAKGTLIYEGRNSLPMFTRFQKRFTRVEGGLGAERGSSAQSPQASNATMIVGYNHQTMSVVTGPGYFVVKPATGEGKHATEPYFDYTEAPPVEPAGWPPFKPNDRGLSRLVYMDMKDYVRRVARGVIVGKAYKLDVDQKAYFSLTLPE
jgi:hypothetical protein